MSYTWTESLFKHELIRLSKRALAENLEKKGTVFLVGAGPGDPGLITVKGVEALARADCVIYDFLANRKLLEHAPPGAETVYVGKKGPSKTMEQEEITALVIERAKKGKTVVRLKGGDPFIFGRGGEEAAALREADIPFEVVPGVTSATAAPAYAGIPLTHREFSSAVTFITGQETPVKERPNIAWDRLSTGRGTLVFLMAWKNLGYIRRKLLENGWPADMPAALIRWGTLPAQKTAAGSLGNIVEISDREEIKPPVVLVVGDVVRLRKKLNWFETRPLFGKKILVTRTAEQAGEFTRILEDEGASPVLFPVIKTVPPRDHGPLDRAIRRLSSYDWAIFTSVNGVKFFFERLYRLGRDVRDLKGVRICAIGPRTEEALTEWRIGVDLRPERFIAEAVIKALGKRRIRGKRFLLPRALVAREVLPEEIKKLGGRIDVVPAYRTIRPRKKAGEVKELVLAGGIDVITFTSSSTVTNFLRYFKKSESAAISEKTLVACIGPVTKKTAERCGLRVDIMPEEYTIPALARAMADYFSNRRSGGRG